MLFCLSFVGFSLPLYLGLIFVMETSASEDSIYFSSILDSDLTSAFLVSTSFEWLIVYSAGDTDGFGPFAVLIPVIRVYEPLELCDP